MTSHDNSPGSDEDGRAAPGSVRSNRRIVMLSILAAVVLIHIAAIVGNRGPVLYSDALGYLGNARFLAGGARPTFDGSFQYAAGYSMLLTPFYWATQRSEIIWFAAVALNVILSVAIMLPAYHLARRAFDLGRDQALIVAAAVSLTPALILQPGRVWVETLFPAVFLASVLAVALLFEKRSVPCAAAAGTLVGYLVFAHGRGLAVAVAFLIVLIVGVAAKRLPPLIAGIGAISTGVVVAIDLLTRSYLRTQLWSASDAPANIGSVSRILGAYAPDHLVATLTTALGHLWYVVTASFGVALVGFVALAFIVAKAERRISDRSSIGIAALFALVAVAGVTVLSAGLLSEVNRVDHRVYGRYLDAVTPVLVLVGTAWLLKARASWRWLAGAALAVPVAGLTLYWTRGPDQFVGNVQKFAIPGLLGLQSIVERSHPVFLEGLDILAISGLAALIGISAAFVIRRNRVLGVAAVIVFTVGITFIGKATSWDPFAEFWFDAYANVPGALNDIPEDRPVLYDMRFLDPDARNLYEFRLAPRRLTFVGDSCSTGAGDLLISSDDPRRVGASASLLASDTVPDQGLWVISDPIAGSCGRS